jgi:3-isopropylmalate/(R)-2-methylmalate dehydratase small subunit
MKAAEGKALKYGDNVDTDVIIPARYLAIQDKEELASHAMEDIDAQFREKLKAGDLVIGGRNFGCGSSREHAPQVLLTSGVGCVIAESFARIFYRNAINIGLPIIEASEAAREIAEGDQVKVDFDLGVITDLTTGKSYQGEPFPPFLQEMIDQGGLMNYVNNHHGKI